MADDPNKVTYFAETDSRHDHKKFGIKALDRSKHVYVIGKTGMGKSTLLENMAIQDIQSGNGVAFIDPHGATAEKLLEYVPEERIKDVLYLAPFDIDFPVAFNVMEDVGAEKRHLVVSGLMSAFMKLFGEESFSDRMQYILQNTILALLEYPGSTMLGINKMLVDKAYRTKVIENITDPSVKAYWTQEFAGYTERFAAEAIPAIQNKIGQFTSNPLIRNIIGQPKSSFNFRNIMDEKKIVIVNLSKGRVGEGNARLLGSMLITRIYLAAMSRADENVASLSKLPQFYLFVDEFQSFADKSFADILSEARKYKLNLTMANQYIEQMEEEVRDAVFGNVGTMIAFRVGAYDADVLEKEFAPVFIAEDLVNLGLRQIYLKLMIDSVTSQPFSATTLAPIEKPPISYVEEIIKNSRAAFARGRSEVEKSIVDWHEEGKAAVASPAKKLGPKPIDTRNIIRDLPVKAPATAAAPPKVPPQPRISLEELKRKANNQRKPDVKNVSALRDALKTVMGSAARIEKPVNVERKPEPLAPPKNEQPKANGPSPEELNKILNG
jgi:energy-coupling factor transporter ATP-binding protein EcfA2